MKVLLVGGTGLVGTHITQELLATKQFDVRLLVRESTLAQKKPLVERLVAAGATLVEGDLQSAATLVKAQKGVDAVVSAIGSLNILDQILLVKAAKECGVKRFIASDFGVDHRQDVAARITPTYQKRVIANHVRAEGVPYTLIFCGGFQEWYGINIGDPAIYPPIGAPQRVRHYQSNKKVRLIGCPDIAKVVSRVLMDSRAHNQIVHIDGETLTQREILDIWRSLGQTVEEIPVSREEHARQSIEAAKAGPTIEAILSEVVQAAYFDGVFDTPPTGALTAEALYPDLKIRTLKEYYQQVVIPARA